VQCSAASRSTALAVVDVVVEIYASLVPPRKGASQQQQQQLLRQRQRQRRRPHAASELNATR